MSRRIIIFIFLILSFTSAFSGDRYTFSSEKQRQQFVRLTYELRCMVCQNENIASSTSQFAEDLREKIFHMVLQRKSDQAIKDYMTARYGNFILFKPPFVWETYLLWFSPLIFLLIAFSIAYLVCRNYRGS